MTCHTENTIVKKQEESLVFTCEYLENDGSTSGTFSRARKVEGYYWPSRSPHPDRYNLPIIHSNLSNSSNEQ